MKTLLALILFCSLSVLAQIPPAPLQWMEMAATPKVASGGSCLNTNYANNAGAWTVDMLINYYNYTAFQFTATNTGTICSADIIGFTRGTTPPANWSVAIYSDSAGTPGSPIGTASATIPTSGLPSVSSTGTTFTGMSCAITSGTVYWIVIYVTAVGISDNCFDWQGYDNSAARKGSLDGSSWDTLPASGAWYVLHQP